MAAAWALHNVYGAALLRLGAHTEQRNAHIRLFFLFRAACSVAFKLVSSTNLAASVHAKEMGSGEYNFIPDGDVTPARLNPSTLTTVSTTSLKACQQACSDVNLCAGIAFGKMSGDDTIASCKLIMGVSKPGNSLRTLIKASFQALNTDKLVAPGFYIAAGDTTNTVQPCSAYLSGVIPDHFYCPGTQDPATPLVAPYVRCDPTSLQDHATTPARSITSSYCGSVLEAGWYYKHSNGLVTACPADFYW